MRDAAIEKYTDRVNELKEDDHIHKKHETFRSIQSFNNKQRR